MTKKEKIGFFDKAWNVYSYVAYSASWALCGSVLGFLKGSSPLVFGIIGFVFGLGLGRLDNFLRNKFGDDLVAFAILGLLFASLAFAFVLFLVL